MTIPTQNQEVPITVETLYQMFTTLKDQDRGRFIGLIINELQKTRDSEEINIPDNNESVQQFLLGSKKPGEPVPCPHCGCLETVKYGRQEGRQRYKCKTCGKTFSLTTNTILYKTHKSLSTWEKYLDCMVRCLPLRECAEICHIKLPTAFYWRHKILDTLRKMQEKVNLKGVVEADETFFGLSFKGNHKKSKVKLPRKSKERAQSASKRGLSRELVCVSGAINLNGLSVAKVSNLGKPGLQDFRNVLGERIEEESLLVTDSHSAYKKFAEEIDVNHIPIKPGRHTNGAFNIQKMNAYHGLLKKLVNRHFCGVATKYLNNYIVYHNFVNYSKGKMDEKWQILMDWCLTIPLSVTVAAIRGRNPIPVLRATPG